jgi:hypothetical protein
VLKKSLEKLHEIQSYGLTINLKGGIAMNKIMYQVLLYSLTFLVFFISGCVTPVPVKDASTKHTQNLMALDQSVKNYRNSIASYYNHLIEIQRQAYIAYKTGNKIHNIATTQSNSLKDLPQDASTDFITAGTIIADDFAFWGRNFDIWMNNFKGKSLADKKRWLQEEVERLAQVKDERATNMINIYKRALSRTDDDLTYIAVSADLKQQKAIIDAQLELLNVQVNVMQAFHRKVDEFLSMDATIDGAKIAEAAAAGAELDLSSLPGLERALKGEQ